MSDDKQKKSNKKIDFDKSISRLEEIARQLESGDMNLEQSLKVYEEGISLLRSCQKIITETERKVYILKNGDKISTDEDQDFDSCDDSDSKDADKKKPGSGKKISESDFDLFEDI